MAQVKDSGEKTKALFVQRFVAFLIDALLVSMIVSVVSMPFIDTKKTETLEKNITSLMEKYTNKEISMNEFSSEYISIYYRLGRQNGIPSLISIFVGVCYFIAYQTYKNGQTIGKKLMKIRVVPLEGELFMNQMIMRSFLANFLLMDICVYLFMLFSPKYVYFYSSAIIETIQYIMVGVSVVMIMYRKDGCAIHDKLVRTKVIREK